MYLVSYLATAVFLYWQRTRRRRRRGSLALVSMTNSSRLRPYSLSDRRIDVVESSARCEKILTSKSRELLGVLGLDCEWVSQPGKRGGGGEERGERRGGGQEEGEGKEGGGGKGGGGEGGHPVALLQLAFLDGHCVLVRLCKTGALPPALSSLLQDNKYKNCGRDIIRRV